MFVCPVCHTEIEEENKLVKHLLSCWKEHNPSHKPKEAPRSPDIETISINDDIKSFFERGKV